VNARSFTFSHAIVRKPGHSIIDGLSSADNGTPNLVEFQAHHTTYVELLRSTGATVIELPADEAFPDSVFVEDAALCLPELAITMQPGTPTRLGEARLIKPELSQLYDTVLEHDGPGTIEGGDILTMESEILIGLSARTSANGVETLKSLVAPWGYNIRLVNTPKDILHFKTDCSLLNENTVLSTKRLDASGCFKGYNVVHTADGEEACANAIRFNDLVIMPHGFPRTQNKLIKEGFNVKTVPNAEAAKLDGGMSCLSLRFTPG